MWTFTYILYQLELKNAKNNTSEKVIIKKYSLFQTERFINFKNINNVQRLSG